jgi:hypothetical protein
MCLMPRLLAAGNPVRYSAESDGRFVFVDRRAGVLVRALKLGHGSISSSW